MDSVFPLLKLLSLPAFSEGDPDVEQVKPEMLNGMRGGGGSSVFVGTIVSGIHIVMALSC